MDSYNHLLCAAASTKMNHPGGGHGLSVLSSFHPGPGIQVHQLRGGPVQERFPFRI